MKKTVIVLSLLATIGMGACDKKEDVVVKEEALGKAEVVVEAISEAQQRLDKAEYTEEGLLGIIANKKAVTAIEYEALLLAIEKCEVDEKSLSLSYECPALKAMRTFDDSHDYVMTEGVDASDIKSIFMKSDMRKLQSWLISNSGSFLSVEDQNSTALLNIEKAANTAIVTRAVISKLSNKMSDRVVADFILSHANDKDAEIRALVCISATSSWSKDVDGILDIALKCLDDEDKNIRRCACSRLGNLENEQVIETIVAILKDNEQVYLHDVCLEALYTLWYGYPFHEKTSEAAYKATLDYLKQKPRTDKRPPWMSVGKLSLIGTHDIETWKTKASYFKADEFIAVMTDIAADAVVDNDARSSAIDVIAAWGTKKDLEVLKLKLAADSSPEAAKVVKDIDKAISEKDAQ